MALTAYLNIEGNTQGRIEGEAPQKGREGMIEVYGINHKIEIPRDTHTGLPTGQRVHLPLELFVKVGSQTPKMMQACTSGEQMRRFQLDFYRITEKGKEEHYYTIKLDNAILVSTELETPTTFLEENRPYHDMEKLSFTYSKIIHTFEPKGIEADDDWNTPKV